MTFTIKNTDIDANFMSCVIEQLQHSHRGCAIHVRQVITLDRENGWVVTYDREPVGERDEGLDWQTQSRVAYVRPDWVRLEISIHFDMITEA